MSPQLPAVALLGTARRDFLWFVGPGLAAAAIGLAIGLLDPRSGVRDAGLGVWIVGVLLVDVAHVYASLYRTYFDPVARRLHRGRLVWAPLVCAGLGFLLHLRSPLSLWMVLAYVAIFHFIKQHVGFALLYVRAGGESRQDRRMVEAAVWAGTAGPVLYWHANLPTEIAWFMHGDLIQGVPGWLGTLAICGQLPVWVAFGVRRIQLYRAGRGHSMVPWLVLIPAINWHLGIVLFDDDRIFTITNVFLHGIPYMALVWVAGGRQRVTVAVSRVRPGVGLAPVLVGFYGLLVVLAYAEETLWDRLIWHDHPMLFGASGVSLDPDSVMTALVVALLTVPQATHYLLDRWIWRVGPQNPELGRQLGLVSSSR